MLRISKFDSNNHCRFVVEAKLITPWIRETRIEALRDLSDSDCAPSIARTGAHQWALALQRVTTPHQITHQGALQ